MYRIPFTDELPPHVTLAVVTRVLRVALRIAIQGIPEAPTGHEHHGFSIAVGDGDELMMMEDLGEGDGPEPVYFSPYDHNPFSQGDLKVDDDSVIRGAFNGDGLCVVDGRTAKCRAATMIVLSMKGGGSTGGGRHRSSRALSKQPGGGCVLAFVCTCLRVEVVVHVSSVSAYMSNMCACVRVRVRSAACLAEQNLKCTCRLAPSTYLAITRTLIPFSKLLGFEVLGG